MGSQTISPAVQALGAICDVLDAVGDDHMSSPLQSTHHCLHRALDRRESISVDQLCTDLADSLSDVSMETRLMTENLFSSESVFLFDSNWTTPEK